MNAINRESGPSLFARLKTRFAILGARLLSKVLWSSSQQDLQLLDNSIAVYGSEDNLRTALITVLGLNVADGLEALDAAKKGLGATHRLICVTDSADIISFYHAGALVEHIPARKDRLAYTPDLQWSEYLRDRYELLVSKWRPEVVLVYGDSFENLIDMAVTDENRIL